MWNYLKHNLGCGHLRHSRILRACVWTSLALASHDVPSSEWTSLEETWLKDWNKEALTSPVTCVAKNIAVALQLSAPETDRKVWFECPRIECWTQVYTSYALSPEDILEAKGSQSSHLLGPPIDITSSQNCPDMLVGTVDGSESFSWAIGLFSLVTLRQGFISPTFWARWMCHGNRVEFCEDQIWWWIFLCFPKR